MYLFISACRLRKNVLTKIKSNPQRHTTVSEEGTMYIYKETKKMRDFDIYEKMKDNDKVLGHIERWIKEMK